MKEFSLDLFKMGYVILYKNEGGLFGNAIVAKQISAGFSKEDAQFCHSEISGGGKHAVNISPPLAKLVDITQAHKGRYIRLIRFNNQDYQLKGRYKVAYFSASLNNTGYDIRGIFRFLFKWIGHGNRLWFCSEGCAQSFKMVYQDINGGLSPVNWMPAEFTKPIFQLVWEGLIPA